MLFPDAGSASPLPCIASLPYGRSPIHSLRSRIIYIQELCHTPVLQKFSHHFASRNLSSACASCSKRSVTITDASRPKSAGAPLKSHKVEQVPPCIYRAELVGDLASPSPSFFRLLKDKKQPASGLFSASKP